MLPLSLFLFEIFSIQVRSQEKIIVAFTERKLFVMLDEDGTPKGLDVLVIQNFVRKFNLQVDYYIMDTYENYNFNEEYSDEFSTQTNLR